MNTDIKSSEDLAALVDQDAWYAVRDAFGEAHGLERNPSAEKMVRHDQNYSKYFDLEKWVHYHHRHARSMGLHEAEEPKHILDIGCGSGLLCFVANCFGHTSVGLDVESPMYQQMAEVLGVTYVSSMVRHLQPLPHEFDGYDWISAVATKFDRLEFANGNKEYWDREDWLFFLRDIASRLNEGGKLYMKPNVFENGEPFRDTDVRVFFESISETFNDKMEFIIPKSNLA